jgi:methionyl-tRNA formyltransferase
VRVVFFGTSNFASDILQCLFRHQIEVVAVVTRTDKPQGRSLKISSPPVKELVLQTHPNLPLFQPVKASTPEFVEELKKLSPAVFVVADYGEIMRTILLDLPPLGAINVHGSLLPKYRGAAPIQRSLINGDLETGVTIMQMVLELDAGDILEMVKIPLPPDINFGELAKKIAEISCPALVKVLDQCQKGALKPIPQDGALATLAPKITPQETQIQWNKSATEIHNLIRGLSPQPGAWCWIEIGDEKKRLKIKKSAVVLGRNDGDFSIVPCGKDSLKLLEVQLEGKKSLSIEEFLRGLRGAYKIL